MRRGCCHRITLAVTVAVAVAEVGWGLNRVDKWPAGIFAHCLEIYEHRMNDEVQEY